MADGLLNKASIILTPTGYKAGTLYNVAPVVEPYEDFDFARASVASRVNSSGLVEMVGRTLGNELVTDGDFPTPNINWSVVTGWSVSGGSANYDDTINGQLSQAISLNSGTYKLNFNISNSSGSGARIWIGNAIGNTSYTDNTYEYYTNDDYSIYINVPSNQTTLAFWGNTGGSSFSIDNVSLKEIIDTNNIPRISYDSNGDNGHILLEPTSTNKITYSEDFSEWTRAGGALIESGYLAPDGSNNAYKVSGTSSSSLYLVSITNTTDTRTIWARTVSGTGDVYLCGNLNDADALFTVTPQWQRFELNGFTGGGATTFYAVDFRGSSTLTEVIIWGAQAEALSYATSYIPTNGSTVTRATETATGAGSADLINSTEGVLYAEIAALVDDLSFRTISLSDGTTSNRCVLRYGGTTNRVNVLISSGGSIIFDNNFTLTEITNFNKIAVKWKLNDFALWVDGVERATDTSGAAPIGLSQLQLSNYNSSSNNFYGKCKALAVFNEALSDAELTQLTT